MLIIGEGVDDHGGPYRAALHTAVGEEPPGFLQLLTPCVNSKSDSGESRQCFTTLHSTSLHIASHHTTSHHTTSHHITSHHFTTMRITTLHFTTTYDHFLDFYIDNTMRSAL